MLIIGLLKSLEGLLCFPYPLESIFFQQSYYRLSNFFISLNKPYVVACQSQKPLKLLISLGLGQSTKLANLVGFATTPWVEIMCPKYSSFDWPNIHFFLLTKGRRSLNALNVTLMCPICVQFLLYTKISLKNTKMNIWWWDKKIIFINNWNVSGVLIDQMTLPKTQIVHCEFKRFSSPFPHPSPKFNISSTWGLIWRKLLLHLTHLTIHQWQVLKICWGW